MFGVLKVEGIESENKKCVRGTRQPAGENPLGACRDFGVHYNYAPQLSAVGRLSLSVPRACPKSNDDAVIGHAGR
jgi:hypothetical protein